MIHKTRNAYHWLKRLSKYWLMVLVSASCLPAMSQQTVLPDDARGDFSELVKEFDQGLYGRCIRSAEKYIEQYKENNFDQFILEAELYQLKSGLRLDNPGTINRILAFARDYKPEAVSDQAILLLGAHAYEQQDYDEAIKYFGLVDGRALSPEDQSALNFKLGYVLFIKKEFDKAATYFNYNREVRDKYYYPCNYYYGMTQYFKEDYAGAIKSFERVSSSEFYKDYIPYYITQIYFSKDDYNKVIGYGTQAIHTETVLNKTEIRQLIGQALFETGDYAAAIPHLAYVEANTDKLRTDDFYQLGMAYYYSDDYEKAIPVLLQIRNEKGIKAHYANYYLAQSYLKTGDKISARNSLMKASQRDEVPSVAMESTFHYGRLCAEAGDDAEALRVLQLLPVTSSEYNQAQETMAGILTNTSDYSLAIQELESMSSLSSVLRGAYQKVCLYRAEQLIQEGSTADANTLLDKSLTQLLDKIIEARTYFWKGEIAHMNGHFDESIKWYDKYFSIVQPSSKLPFNQSVPIASYTQGYNYLRQSNYAEAQKLFEQSIKGLEGMQPLEQRSQFREQVYADAVLRAGDCAFKRSQYDKATTYYLIAISNKYSGSDYAAYQVALIKGLQNLRAEKIRLLEKLVADNPHSSWADDALFQAGNTYHDDKQTEKAIQSYGKIVKDYSDSSPLLLPALLRLGVVTYNSGQFERSLNYYKEVFKHNPDPESSKEAIAAIQEIYINELENPEAFFAFAEDVPGFNVSGSEKDSILYSAAENFYAIAEYEKAAASFKKYITTYPDGIYTLKAKYLRAECLVLVKDYNEALRAFEEVIAIGKSVYYVSSLYKAALIAYNHTEAWSKAYDYYIKYFPLADSEEKSFEATLGALRCAYKMQDAEKVFASSEAVIQHERATDDYRALAYYYQAKIAYQEKEYAKAVSAFNAVIKINSADLAAEARYYIASVYELNGEPALAAKLAEEAARANVGYPFWVAKSLLLLSDIQFSAGDLLNARAILEAITENFYENKEIMKEATEKLSLVKREEERVSRIKPEGGDILEMQPNPKED